MKRLLSIVAGLTLITTSTTTVMACASKHMAYYNQLIDGVKAKDTFVFMVSAKDCVHCVNTIDTTIPALYTNDGKGTQLFQDYLNGNREAQYSLANYNVSDADQDKIRNSRLIITSAVEKYSDLWSQKWGKKIAEWVVTQERNANLINGEIDKTITADSIGLKSTPTFIYIKNGNYVGFKTGGVGTIETGANTNLYMQWFVKHIILEDWNQDVKTPEG